MPTSNNGRRNFGTAPARTHRLPARPSTGPTRPPPPTSSRNRFRSPGGASWADPAPSTGRCSCAACPRTTTAGPPRATTSGPIVTSCPSSASWNPTPTCRTTFTAATAPFPWFARPATPGIPSSTRFVRACAGLGYPEDSDMNHPSSAAGVGPAPMNNPAGIRMSCALAYLSAARHRLNLTVRGNVVVRRVLFDGQPPSVSRPRAAVRFSRCNGREIVICASGIASPQLLMLSGVGPADHLADLGIPWCRTCPACWPEPARSPAGVRGQRAASRLRPCRIHGSRIQTLLRYTTAGSDSRNDMHVYVNNVASGPSPLGSGPGTDQPTLRMTCILQSAESRASCAWPRPTPTTSR